MVLRADVATLTAARDALRGELDAARIERDNAREELDATRALVKNWMLLAHTAGCCV